MRRDTNLASLLTLSELCRHVLGTLCSRDCLDASGRLCGFFFPVKGPRLLKLYAVWAADERCILFYDEAGSRFAQTRLREGPDCRELAA